MDTIIDIYELQGINTNRAYSKTQSNIRGWIVPASTESIALYEGMPQGQEFEFRILSDDITGIRAQGKLVVVNSQVSGFSNGDTFITVANARRVRIMGRNYLTGICYKTE